MENEKFINIKLNENEYNVPLLNSNNEIITGEDYDLDLTEILDVLNGDELYDYLYRYQINKFEDINRNSDLFDGKKINSGDDLKQSIQNIKQLVYSNGVVYVCGEYWCDPEHGFSIKFPNAKFIKSGYNLYDYDRDESFITVCTLIGEYSDYL